MKETSKVARGPRDIRRVEGLTCRGYEWIMNRTKCGMTSYVNRMSIVISEQHHSPQNRSVRGSDALCTVECGSVLGTATGARGGDKAVTGVAREVASIVTHPGERYLSRATFPPNLPNLREPASDQNYLAWASSKGSPCPRQRASPSAPSFASRCFLRGSRACWWLCGHSNGRPPSPIQAP